MSDLKSFKNHDYVAKDNKIGYKEQDNINDHNDIEISSNIYSIDQGSILFDKVGINFDDEGNKNIINLNSSKLKHLL